MFFGNRRPRNVTARDHGVPVFQPRCERLEAKILMAIDLGGTSPPNLPFSATIPTGIDMAEITPNQGAGYSVADVADLTGSGFDDILIGAPGVTGSPPTTVSSSGTGFAYLVFGSTFVASASNPVAIQNWLNVTGATQLANNDRVGSLAQLGTASQTNPISGSGINFPFSGITFTGVASLGASVAGVTLTSGQNAILIGAPNANSGSGAAYLISGNFALLAGQTINVTQPPPSGLRIVTFVNTASYAASGQLGFSVAGGFNILGDGSGDVILGAPNASVAPTTTQFPVPQNTGVTYVISAGALSGNSQTIDVSTLLSAQAIDISGASTGDKAGFSVADAGNVNGASGNIDDLLIGAPQAANSAGAAYLVYGGNLANLRSTVNGIPFITLANVTGGAGTGTAVPGAILTGPAGGSQTGFSVSAGGDFNADGFGDILIGSPTLAGSSTLLNQGAVYLLYGAASTSPAFLTGVIPLGAIPTAINSVTLTGAFAGDMAGYSVSQVGVINAGQPTGILIGAPGFTNNGQAGLFGTVYLIPGRINFTGAFSLATEQSSPLSGLQFVMTTPAVPTSNTFFGASVSGRVQGTQLFTVDQDKEADFVIGAPGYNALGLPANVLAGGAQIVESGFLQVPIPASNTIVAQIGVNTPFAPFSINATTPAALQIFVFGVPATASTPQFSPVTDIDPTTVKVDGIAFPNATLVADTNTANHLNGIVDAIITISPRSALNLPSGSVKITIAGKTLTSSPLPNFTWTGSATVTVTGGTGGGGSGSATGAAAAPATGPVLETQFVSPFGANQFSPSITAFSALNYQALPLSVAINEYLPPTGFRARLYAFNHPGKKVGISRGQNQGRASGINTLASGVFSRGVFHAKKIYTFTHKAPKVGNVTGVVPIQARLERFDDNLLR